MQSTICLPRVSNSLPLECNEHKIIKRAFKGYNVGFKVRGRGGQMSWEWGAINHDNYGASNTLPNKYNNSNPKITYNKYFILFFLFFFFLCVFFSTFVFCFCFQLLFLSFFFFFFTKEDSKIKNIIISNSYLNNPNITNMPTKYVSNYPLKICSKTPQLGVRIGNVFWPRV